MGIGASIFLLAIGAVLSFAVDANVEGINLDAVGVILMVLGGIGLLATLVLWNDTVPWNRPERLPREPLVEGERLVSEDPTPVQERVIYRAEAPVFRKRVVYRGSRGA